MSLNQTDTPMSAIEYEIMHRHKMLQYEQKQKERRYENSIRLNLIDEFEKSLLRFGGYGSNDLEPNVLVGTIKRVANSLRDKYSED